MQVRIVSLRADGIGGVAITPRPQVETQTQGQGVAGRAARVCRRPNGAADIGRRREVHTPACQSGRLTH